MRQIVLLKDIPDLSEIKVDPATRAPRLEGVKRRISDLDKRALEAALRIKEAVGGEVVALSMGDEKTRTSMLEALAMGADSAYVVDDLGLRGLDANATSLVLAAALRKVGGFDLVLAGEMTLDSLGSQVGPRVAELLSLPQLAYAKEVSVTGSRARAVMDLEDVDEVAEAGLPALVTVVREINEPRIPSLINIMKAKKKPLTVWAAQDLGLDAGAVRAASHVRVLGVTAPKVERKQIRVEADTVEEAAVKLVQLLVGEGVVK
jgi:electron transfer flavoprotein beta subunit